MYTLIEQYPSINLFLVKVIATTIVTSTNKEMEKKIDKGGKFRTLLNDLYKAFDSSFYYLLNAQS